jgi:hypothetical protein
MGADLFFKNFLPVPFGEFVFSVSDGKYYKKNDGIDGLLMAPLAENESHGHMCIYH